MMWRVTLSSDVFDPLGSVTLDAKPESELSAVTRRVTRTATLDGGATLEDLGHCPADATLSIQVRIKSMDEESRLLRLIKIYPLLTISTQYGVFRGVVDYFKPTAGGASLRFLVQSQLSA